MVKYFLEYTQAFQSLYKFYIVAIWFLLLLSLWLPDCMCVSVCVCVYEQLMSILINRSLWHGALGFYFSINIQIHLNMHQYTHSHTLTNIHIQTLVRRLTKTAITFLAAGTLLSTPQAQTSTTWNNCRHIHAYSNNNCR